MKHNEVDKPIDEISRRKFLVGSVAAGALAMGGVLAGNKHIFAQSFERLRSDRWEVSIDGKVVKEGLIPLEIKQELLIPVQNGTARIVFDQGRIYLPEDNNICEKKICSLMGSITKSGETITCLPNKLVIRIL
ncbi:MULTISPECIES: NusG domain II-containing protein [unclassified Dehalobacter]|uniref:NusG domain II-containing protein n=1 Tax=unclassified Dehalobacter TaxID=2635733 RepID=UPI00187338DB|nr:MULTISPECIES: NusG domain II-containing protein [unclassified Dehalobacter]MDJ0306440.1 NusG domain II-containing protein [Dehalobacter sp.]